MFRDGLLVDISRPQFSCKKIGCDTFDRVDNLDPTTVVERKDHRHGRVGGGQLLGRPDAISQYLRHAFVIDVAHEQHPNTQIVELISSAFEEVDVELHQERNLEVVTVPVLGRERVDRQPLNTQFKRSMNDIEECWFAIGMTLGSMEATGIGPSTISIHDDPDMCRDRAAINLDHDSVSH